MGNYMPGPPFRQMMTPQVKKNLFFQMTLQVEFFSPFAR